MRIFRVETTRTTAHISSFTRGLVRRETGPTKSCSLLSNISVVWKTAKCFAATKFPRRYYKMAQKQIDPFAFLAHVVEVTPRGDVQKVYDALTSAEHPTDHTFEEDPAWPGTCKVCHWVDGETKASCCGKSAHSHVQTALQMATGPVIGYIIIEL